MTPRSEAFVTLLNTRDFDGAELVLSQLRANIDTPADRILGLESLLRFAQGRHAEAFRLIAAAKEAAPMQLLHWYNHSHYLLELGEWESAARVLQILHQKCLQTNDEFFLEDCVLHLAFCYKMLGDSIALKNALEGVCDSAETFILDRKIRKEDLQG